MIQKLFDVPLLDNDLREVAALKRQSTFQSCNSSSGCRPSIKASSIQRRRTFGRLQLLSMSVAICSGCLSRLSLSSRLPAVSQSLSVVSASSFHSSATQYASPLKKKAGTPVQNKFREARSAKIKKKTKDRPRPPPIGERKAQRKRIVLSNTNALEIAGLEDLNPTNMADTEKIGQVLGIQGDLLDNLRDAKAFKTTQNWNMFRRPATLVREETVSLGQHVRDVIDSQQNQGLGAKVARQVVSGERASGKSIHLLQAMSMAYMNGWIVINVPEGQWLQLIHVSVMC